MHLVTAEGKVLVGARSVPEILRHLPRYRWLRAVFAVPGVPFLADRVYWAIAKRRHRLGCGSERCRIGRT
jgi:predicted DCC family thiol-disulfide oxidoreductase YuxK